MALGFKVIDIMNYLNYNKAGHDVFYGGPESGLLLKKAGAVKLPPPITTEEFVKLMDEAGVEKAFLCAFKMGSYKHRTLNIDYSHEMVYEETKKFPDRLIGICGYDPFWIAEGIRAIEKAVKEYGFKGVYCHTLGWGIAANDRRMYPVYSKCVELDIPFSMQIGQSAEPLPSEVGRPMYVDPVNLDFPDLKFICSHTGYPWCEEAISLAWIRDNVYIDVSAHAPNTIPPRMKSLLDFMDSGMGRRKVLWGTNSWPFQMILDQWAAIPLKDETRKAVFRDNAVRLYKL